MKIARRMDWGESLEQIYERRRILNQVQDNSIKRFLPA